MGEGTRGRGEGSEGFGSRGVGGMGTGPSATCVVFLTFLMKKNRGGGRIQGLGEGGPKALVPGG